MDLSSGRKRLLEKLRRSEQRFGHKRLRKRACSRSAASDCRIGVPESAAPWSLRLIDPPPHEPHHDDCNDGRREQECVEDEVVHCGIAKQLACRVALVEWRAA